jgi:phosphate transport system permease protein
MNANPFSGPQAALPLFVFQQIRQPQVALQQRAWAGALVLILLVLGLFTLARFYGYRTARGRLRRAPERVK